MSQHLFPTGVLASRSDLAAAAELLHGFCFDRVELDVPRLSYEPRWSCQCQTCAAIWVASKSGGVMRVGLRIDPSARTARPAQTWFPGNREARTIYHHHGGGTLDGGSYLLIGRDDGALDLIYDNHADWVSKPPPQRRPESIASFHLDSWWDRRHEGAIPVATGVESTPRGRSSFAGITAIAVLTRRGKPDAILAATRYPWLYVIEATGGMLRLRRRRAMPGWIEWIIGPQPGDDRVVLISRSGEIAWASPDELVDGPEDRELVDAPADRDFGSTPLSLLPTAAMPFGSDNLVLGTTTGLFVVSANPASNVRGVRGYSEGIAVPVTQSPVLCLDRVELTIDGKPHTYVIMGLEGRRMRVIDAELLGALASGQPRKLDRDRSFAIEMGDAVLAVEALRPDDGPDNAAYVLAVLRDHSVRLFHVTSPQAQRDKVRAKWIEFVYGHGAPRATKLEMELAKARSEPPTEAAADSWKYLLVDVVLPRLRGEVKPGTEEHREVVKLACGLTAGADRYVLHRLSTTLGRLALGEIGLVLELSRAILAAIPHGDDRRWAAFIDSHLRDLSAIARSARDPNRARLVAWTRFVRKYVLLGNRFAAKQFGLLELIDQNYRIGKYLDALIYQTRMAQRCYDLRWERRVEDDVVEVHTIRCAERDFVVVATVGGRLKFLDSSSGRALQIRRDGWDRPREAVAPFELLAADAASLRSDAVSARTLACAVARDHGRIRVVLSCTGAGVSPPGLAVIEVRPHDADSVMLDSIVRAERDDTSDEDGDDVRVYALQWLPGSDDFVAGLETRRSPLGRLCKQGEGWSLEVAKDGKASAAGTVDRPSLAPGKMPTRAVAVVEVDTRATGYLLVAGSDDGLIRAIWFARTDSAPRWKIHHGHRLTDAISSIALGRHRPPPRRADGTAKPDDSLFSFYVGTTAGDTFAFSVMAHDETAPAGTFARFGDHDARPRWRETHDGPVVAMRLWRTSLYPKRPVDDMEQNPIVLVVVTENGRLCIYNHSPYSSKRQISPDSAGRQVSASGNYYFRGMRFDRVALADRIHALSMEADTAQLVAAGAGGRVYMARLAFLRDSLERQDPERRDAPPPSGEPGELPMELWQRQHHLLARSRIEEPFESDPSKREALKLELCELVRMEGGPLAVYALRERLQFREPWRKLEPDDLRKRAQRLLLPLSPEKREDAEKIKVILKTLCRSFLLVPEEPQAQLVLLPADDPARSAQTATTCEVVSEYIARGLARSTRAAARMRIVAIKELLRVQVLSYIAGGGDDGGRVRAALEEAIDSCLRDDERLVRLETLRALSVMLRNAGVAAEAVPGVDRGEFVRALFPDGLGSISWLLALIAGGLQRYPSFTRQTALVSDAWYYVKALVGFFRIFPDRTLALCDYLVRHGLGVEVLAICFQSLPRQGAAIIRSRIEHLYLLSVLEQPDAKAQYIKRYDTTRPEHTELLTAMKLDPAKPSPDAKHWHELDDAMMAHRLIELHGRLAHMWSISDEDQIAQALTKFAAPTPRSGLALDPHDLPAGELESVVDTLASIAAGLAYQTPAPLERLTALGAQHGLGNESTSPLTQPLRTIVSRVVTTWHEVYNPPLAERGAKIGIYTLGAPFEQGGFGTLFAIDEPPNFSNHVIKVLHRNSPSAIRRFLEGARFSKELYDDQQHGQYVVQVTDIINERPRPAYVMRKYEGVLDKYLNKNPWTPPSPDLHTSSHATDWTHLLAVHIARALYAAHRRWRWHGDVKPTNILVNFEGPTVFRLGDFDLSFTDPTDITPPPGGIVPLCLSVKAWNQHLVTSGGDDAVADQPASLRCRQWNDVAALSLILYRMLTGEIIEPTANDLRGQLERLRSLASGRQIAKKVQRIVETLIAAFDENEPPFTIREFLRRIDPPAESPQIRLLFLGADPSPGSQLSLTREVTQIRERLESNTRFYIEDRWEVRADRLYLPIAKFKPDILHFSGHGNPDGELVFHGPGDEAMSAPIAAITELFRILAKKVRCVVLSACYSEPQAMAIAEHIPVVIGMKRAIADDDAIEFASAFYAMLGMGSDVQEAFETASGVLAVRQRDRRDKRRDLEQGAVLESEPPVPCLHVQSGFDPKTLSFVPRSH